MSNLLHGVPWSLLYVIRLRWGRCGGAYTLTIIDMAREDGKIEPPKRLRNINKLCYFWSNPK